MIETFFKKCDVLSVKQKNLEELRLQKTSKLQFEDFLTQSTNAKSPEELFSCLTTAVANHGFDKLIFSVTYDGDLPKDKNKLGVFHNYNESWDKFYREKRYDLIDPVLKCAATYSHAFKWSDLEKELILTPKQHRFFREGEDAGLLHGVGIPMRGSRGQLSGIALASSEKIDACDQNLDLLTAYCNQFYISYKRFFISTEKVAQQEMISLTVKETEVLHWLFASKTDDEIAVIMGITRHTVDTYIRRIYEKLGVHNRIGAAIKGLMLGLVTP